MQLSLKATFCLSCICWKTMIPPPPSKKMKPKNPQSRAYHVVFQTLSDKPFGLISQIISEVRGVFNRQSTSCSTRAQAMTQDDYSTVKYLV